MGAYALQVEKKEKKPTPTRGIDMRKYLCTRFEEVIVAIKEAKAEGNIWSAVPIFVVLVAIAIVMYIGQMLGVNLLMTLVDYKGKLTDVGADQGVLSAVDDMIKNQVELNKTYGDIIGFVSVVAVVVFIVQVFVPIVPQILAMFSGGGGRRRGSY